MITKGSFLSLQKTGYSDKYSFVEKYGKDKIVKNMIIQKAQDIVMDNAVYK